MYTAAVQMLSFDSAEWDAHAETTLRLAALEAAAERLAAHAEWSTLAADEPSRLAYKGDGGRRVCHDVVGLCAWP